MGEGLSLVGPGLCLGEGSRDLTLGGHLTLAENVSVCAVCACELVCAKKHVCTYMCVLAAKLRAVGAGQGEEGNPLSRELEPWGEGSGARGPFLWGTTRVPASASRGGWEKMGPCRPQYSFVAFIGTCNL